MVKAAGVRFSDNGRIYYFNPNNIELKVGDQVITETRRRYPTIHITGAISNISLGLRYASEPEISL